MGKRIFMLGLGISLATAGLASYLTLNNNANKEIEEAVLNRHFLPKEWVTILPGKTDKTINLYLENIEHIYSNTSEIYRHLVPNYLLLFSEDHSPERIPEVARKGVDFLIEKKDFEAAYRIAEASRSQFLINYVTERTGYEHKPFIEREKTEVEKQALKELTKFMMPMIEKMVKNHPIGKFYQDDND